MNGGPSGFHNAPVTRAVMAASALITVVFGVRGRSLKLGLSYQDIYKSFHIWKMITSAFAFSSTPELMFGLCLLYYFRVFERQLGSNKHSVFVLFSVVVSSLLEVLALLFLKEYNVGSLSAGPYGLIFASFVPFYFDIPVSSRFRVFSLHFSDKSFLYLAGLQLLLSSWKRSLVPGICGLLAGALYRLNLFGIRRLKFPKMIASLFAQLSRPSSGSPTNRTSRGYVTQNGPPYTGRQLQANYPAAPHVTVSEPPESSIATLVSMGFDSNDARQALIHSSNDVNAATNILLEAQSH